MKRLNTNSKCLGILIILSILFGITSSVPALEQSGYLSVLFGISHQVRFASLFQICMAFAYIGIIVVIHPLMKIYSEKMASYYFIIRIVSVCLLFFSVIFLLCLVSISTHYTTTAAGELTNLEFVGELVRISRDWINHILVIITWTLGGAIMYSFLFTSELVPKNLSIGGLIGSLSTLTVTIALLFNQVQIVSITYLVMNLPLALTEIILAIYLLKKGFNKDNLFGIPV